MSKDSMPPLPTGNMPVADDSSSGVTKSDTEVDLSQIRQGWSKKFNELDSLPVDTASPPANSSSTPVENLPEIPSLGAMASMAAMSMDDLDDFLARHHQPDTVTAPSHATVNVSDQQEPVPEMPTSSIPPDYSLAASPEPPSRGNLNAIPAFPTPSLPEASSMPLIRDTMQENVQDTTPLTPPPAPTRPDFTDLRKTAPQFSKFSPETQEETLDDEAAVATPKETVEETPNFTDEDLREALQPIIDPVVDQFLYTPSQGVHTYLEPMLRSTVRRAIAEQMHDASPFDASGWDKFAWKLRSMFSSRTYDDIVFDYTRRYQVEEVYLLRPHSRSLISYASHDPVRHVKPKKIQSTVKKIASKESEHKDEDTPWVKWRDTRNLMIRRGEHCILAAIVHGPSNAILRADLDYALRQAEERFGKALEEESDIHMQILQPLLEGCLLIQAPAIPN